MIFKRFSSIVDCKLDSNKMFNVSDFDLLLLIMGFNYGLRPGFLTGPVKSKVLIK